MFERLVVSTSQRRQRRTLKFFVYTSFIYLSVVGIAFALSVVLESPKLADTSTTQLRQPFFPTGGARSKPRNNRPVQAAPTRDLRNPEVLENIISNVGHRQPLVTQYGPPGTKPIGPQDGGGDVGSFIPGNPSLGQDFNSGVAGIEAPRPPDPPKPQPRTADKAKPLPVSSVVLQGKAIDRVVPVYPELAKRIGLKGDVSLEIIISPEGRVESVRVVSGHLMLIKSATDAALRWRFEPTFLNGVPVRVTGVITFVFKIS